MNNPNTKYIGVPRMVSLLDASKLTGMSYAWLRGACMKNEIVYVKAGNKYFVNLDRLADYLNGGENGNQ